MGRFVKLSVAMACVSLCACVSVSPQVQGVWTQDIDLALGTSPQQLHDMAMEGDRHAMIAYAVVLRYGLHGVAADPAQADGYVAHATQPVRYQTTSIWVPKTKDKPGYMMPLTTPVYDYSPGQAHTVAICAEVLAAAGETPGLDARLQRGLCGGVENYHRLKGLWHGTRQQDGRTL